MHSIEDREELGFLLMVNPCAFDLILNPFALYATLEIIAGRRIRPLSSLPQFTLEQVYDAFSRLGFPARYHQDLLKSCLRRGEDELIRRVRRKRFSDDDLFCLTSINVEVYCSEQAISESGDALFRPNSEHVVAMLNGNL